jgi:DeoR/GlpR family transcriptional regulator of sugar metabolism
MEGSVLARQRQAYILDRVREDGGVRVSDLVRTLGVSDMTIRRDLEFLHERGLIEKVHGGATMVLPESVGFEPGFAAKSGLQQAEKEAIAEAAFALVSPGQAIAISAGTTTYGVARRLAEIPGLTVVTNSVPVADALHEAGRLDHTIILTGGVRTRSNALVGPFASAALRGVHVDLVFMGVHGMDTAAGFTSPNLLEAETDRALIAAGRRLVVCADHTKWGVVALSSIARLDEADVVISDSGLDAVAREALSGQVAELIIAEPHPAASALPDATGTDERSAPTPIRQTGQAREAATAQIGAGARD